MARSTETTPDTSDGYHTFRELYNHRHALFMLLLHWAPEEANAWWSLEHHDGGDPMFEGYFIAGMRLPDGPITYHLPIECLISLPVTVTELPKAPMWDGHTPEDVVRRVELALLQPKHRWTGTARTLSKDRFYSAVKFFEYHRQELLDFQATSCNDINPDDPVAAKKTLYLLQAERLTTILEHNYTSWSDAELGMLSMLCSKLMTV